MRSSISGHTRSTRTRDTNVWLDYSMIADSFLKELNRVPENHMPSTKNIQQLTHEPHTP